jgi:hypothetical protein
MRSRALSSTTDRDRASGQVIVLFAGALLTLMAIAALAFDVGQTLLDKRTQQDVADASALAGAKYLVEAGCQPVSTLTNCPNAAAAALDMAQRNGYGNGVNNATVRGATVSVKIPPGPESQFFGLSGHIEVQISSTRGGIFSSALGITSWRATAMGVASNSSGISAPYSMLALEPTNCLAIQVGGNGSVSVGGNIQVNSTCPTAAMQVQGQAVIDITVPNGQCNVAGFLKYSNPDHVGCTINDGAPVAPDPLAELPPPAIPPLAPSAVELVGSKAIPSGCPGAIPPPSLATPTGCQFPSNYGATSWRLFPGLYPGGFKLQGGTFYLEPGIYFLAGGGLDGTGNGVNIMSVDAGTTTFGGGVMLFNSDDPTFDPQCLAGTVSGTACIGSISLNGSGSVTHLKPLQAAVSTLFAGLVIYQDRRLAVSGGGDIKLNGNSGTLDVTGTVYVPKGDVVANGNSGTSMTTQIIANTFKVTGNSGTLNISYDGGDFFHLSGVGLVQ